MGILVHIFDQWSHSYIKLINGDIIWNIQQVKKSKYFLNLATYYWGWEVSRSYRLTQKCKETEANQAKLNLKDRIIKSLSEWEVYVHLKASLHLLASFGYFFIMIFGKIWMLK